MAQNYTIFNNHQCLELISQILPEALNGIIILRVEKEEEASKLYLRFLNSELQSPACLYSEKGADWLMSQFRKHCPVIDAAGGLVRGPGDTILLIERRGFLDLPKGKLEKGEGRREAALREVEEECGLKGLELLSKAGVTYHVFSHNDKWNLKRTHWYFMRSKVKGNLKPQAEEDITSACWYSREDVASLLPRIHASLQQLIRLYL